MIMPDCAQPSSQDMRRIFWVTQPDACGLDYDDCRNNACGRAGLAIIRNRDDNGATIAVNNYVRGLILNILLTRGAAANTGSGIKPGARGGHWSDSFTGASSGSSMIDISAAKSTAEIAGLIRASVAFDLQKLIKYGVASSVNVSCAYDGGSRFSVIVSVCAPGGKTDTINMGGARKNNLWVWDAPAEQV